jgi:long-subunit acyl-CoA synthetase (AMP-forming)
MSTTAQAENTFPKLLIRNARLFADRPAYRHKDLGIWQTWTWRQVLEEVRALARHPPWSRSRPRLGRSSSIRLAG